VLHTQLSNTLSAVSAAVGNEGAVGFREEANNKDETSRWSHSDHSPVWRSSGLSIWLDSRQLPAGRSRRWTVSVLRRRTRNSTAAGQFTSWYVRFWLFSHNFFWISQVYLQLMSSTVTCIYRCIYGAIGWFVYLFGNSTQCKQYKIEYIVKAVSSKANEGLWATYTRPLESRRLLT